MFITDAQFDKEQYEAFRKECPEQKVHAATDYRHDSAAQVQLVGGAFQMVRAVKSKGDTPTIAHAHPFFKTTLSDLETAEAYGSRTMAVLAIARVLFVKKTKDARDRVLNQIKEMGVNVPKSLTDAMNAS